MSKTVAILACAFGCCVAITSVAQAQRGQQGMQPGGMGGHSELGAVDHASSVLRHEKMRERRMMRHATPKRPMEHRRAR